MMMRMLPIALLASTAGPAVAASGPFFSLGNSDFVVLIAFLIFVGVLLYAKVPGMLTGMLDKRADDIRSELDEARKLREDAQAILADFQRKQRDVQAEADKTVASAKSAAEAMAEKAKKDLEASIARRMAAAEEQIASAEKAAVREVRNTAISVSVAAARKILAQDMNDERANALVDTAISDVETRLH